MKIAATISRYLLGLVFTVFGSNGFLFFIPPQPMPPLAMQFFGALIQSHYSIAIFAIQLIGGLLLLATSRYVPLALTLLAPVIVNIVLFHATMAPSGLPVAMVVVILWLILAYRVRSAFAPILQPWVG